MNKKKSFLWHVCTVCTYIHSGIQVLRTFDEHRKTESGTPKDALRLTQIFIFTEVVVNEYKNLKS